MNELIATGRYGRLFAVVHFASHQWKVTSEDLILIDNELDVGCGERIRLEKVRLAVPVHLGAPSPNMPSCPQLHPWGGFLGSAGEGKQSRGSGSAGVPPGVAAPPAAPLPQETSRSCSCVLSGLTSQEHSPVERNEHPSYRRRAFRVFTETGSRRERCSGLGFAGCFQRGGSQRRLPGADVLPRHPALLGYVFGLACLPITYDSVGCCGRPSLFFSYSVYKSI